jgi:hypothetical protein
MFNFLIPMVLTTTGFLADPAGIFEPIELAGDLVIDAQYLPPGSTIQVEAMALSLEDFSILRAEVETAASGCNSRLDALRLIQKETVQDIQDRCKERNSHFKSELDLKIKENALLSKSLEEAKSSAKTQLWVNLGVVVSSSILLAIVITR